jgi:hypothetical protein
MEPRASNLLRVVDRQCRRWEFLQKQSARVEPPVHWPVITVAREFGARGEALGRIVADRAGFSFWDGELVHAVSTQSGASEIVLRSLDEQHRSGIEESIDGVLMGGRHMASEYLRRLMRLIKTISHHGASVIVGRGGQYVLEPASALRIRVVCPPEDRIRGYAERQGIDENEARSVVEREDSERRRFIRQFFSRDLANAWDYDLIINTATFSLESAATLVLDAYEAKFGRRPKTGEAVGVEDLASKGLAG